MTPLQHTLLSMAIAELESARDRQIIAAKAMRRRGLGYLDLAAAAAKTAGVIPILRNIQNEKEPA